MGNVNSKNQEPNFTNCRKCTVCFRLPDINYFERRRSCAFHNIKNGKCITCNNSNNLKCFHEKKNMFF